jgi:hypothetical protein
VKNGDSHHELKKFFITMVVERTPGIEISDYARRSIAIFSALIIDISSSG